MPKTEPSLVGALILLVMIAGGVTGLMWEIFVFVRKRTILSPARFAWRIVTWLLIIVVFFGMFAGLYLFQPTDPKIAIRYWSFFLAFAFFVVAFLVVSAYRDWRWLMSEQFRQKVELYHQLGEELRKLSREKPSPKEDAHEQ